MDIFFIVVLMQFYSQCFSQESKQLNSTYPAEFIFPKDIKMYPNIRIIGGNEVIPHSYPFQVALIITKQDGTYFCGGTLLTAQWILTAAHCVDSGTLQIMALMGRHNLSETEASGQLITVEQYAYHKYWNDKTFQNDIALLKLSQNATLNQYVNTVSIATGNLTYTGKSGMILGWGATETESLSLVLKSVTVSILSNEDCRKIHPYNTVIVPTHLCVSGDGIKGSCTGDSGGPLLVGNHQVGIVAFGYTICTASKPSVFTRLTKYNDWIEYNMKGSSNSKEFCGFLSIVLTCFYLLQIVSVV